MEGGSVGQQSVMECLFCRRPPMQKRPRKKPKLSQLIVVKARGFVDDSD